MPRGIEAERSGEGLGHRAGQREGPEPSRLRKLRPMIEAHAPSTGVLQVQIGMVCSPPRR